MRKSFLLFLSELVFLSISCAQTSSTDPSEAAIHNDVQKATQTVTLRADYFFVKGSYLYWEGNYNFNKDYSYLTNNYKIYNQVGYEHSITDHWYIGASVKHQLSYYINSNTLIPKVNFTHRGKIGSLYFIKEFSGEYIHNLSANSSSVKPPANARGAFAVGLLKVFKVAKRPLIGSFNYKIYLNTNMGEIYKNRRFDFIKTRIDLMYGITKNIYAGFYGMLDSEHFYTLANYINQYDSSGNPVLDSNGQPVLVELTPNYRFNRINPVIGISCNFIFRQEGFDKEVLTGLPFR